jgi:hypothetical protein
VDVGVGVGQDQDNSRMNSPLLPPLPPLPVLILILESVEEAKRLLLFLMPNSLFAVLLFVCVAGCNDYEKSRVVFGEPLLSAMMLREST